jgi:hypothetical protein
MLLGVLIYGYATGVFSSRKLERATYDSVAFRYIAANDHPGGAFSRRSRGCSLGCCCSREMGVLKLGTIRLDGTKIHANARRHSALFWERASKLEAQLKAEVADLLARAEAADEADVPDGMSIPEELALREKCLESSRRRARRSRRGRKSDTSASGLDLAQHRFELLLVVRRVNHVGRNDQQAPRGHHGLSVVGPLETAACRPA